MNQLPAKAGTRVSTTDLTAADREALAHVAGLLRAYYQTLLIEPTPERLLGLLDEIDAAWKRRTAARL
jgi:anti-sigma factor NepR-like protein